MQKETFYHLFHDADKLNEQSEQELMDIINEYPYFQLAQILHLKNLKKISSAGFDDKLKKVAVQVPDRKKLFYYLNSSNTKKPNSGNNLLYDKNISMFQLNFDEENIPGNSLIDKFLSSNTSIITPKNTGNILEQQTKNEIVKKSEEETDEIITETLAMILFQQKKYDKALDAFRKLSLKYPEKSVYFATRIEEIEKLKNI